MQNVNVFTMWTKWPKWPLCGHVAKKHHVGIENDAKKHHRKMMQNVNVSKWEWCKMWTCSQCGQNDQNDHNVEWCKKASCGDRKWCKKASNPVSSKFWEKSRKYPKTVPIITVVRVVTMSSEFWEKSRKYPKTVPIIPVVRVLRVSSEFWKNPKNNFQPVPIIPVVRVLRVWMFSNKIGKINGIFPSYHENVSYLLV